MAKRELISEDTLEAIVGGNITYTWDGKYGHCGVSGSYDYSFDDKSEFLKFAVNCINNGMSDQETIDALLEAGIIY